MNMANEKTYQITNLTQNQIKVLSFACDLYSRCIAGQLDTIAFTALPHLPVEQFCEIRNKLRDLSKDVDKAYGTYPASPGIHNPCLPDDARIAFDLYQVFRHQLWLDGPQTYKYTVDAYPCHVTSNEKPPIIGYKENGS